MKILKSFFCASLFISLGATAFADGKLGSYEYSSYQPYPYQLFFRGGASFTERTVSGVDDFPTLGGYVGFGGLWQIANDWQLGAEIALDYIGRTRVTRLSLNNSLIGPVFLSANIKSQDFLYDLAALLVYQVSNRFHVNARLGVGVSAIRQTTTQETVDALRQIVIPITSISNTTETGVLVGAGFKYRIAQPLFVTFDYNYFNVGDLNVFLVGLEFNFV